MTLYKNTLLLLLLLLSLLLLVRSKPMMEIPCITSQFLFLQRPHTHQTHYSLSISWMLVTRHMLIHFLKKSDPIPCSRKVHDPAA